MAAERPPVFMGSFDPVKAGDIVDLYLELANDLAPGEALQAAVFTVYDLEGTVVPNVVDPGPSIGATRVDFRVTAPPAGQYKVQAVCTIDDGQRLTRTAYLWAE